MTVPVWMGFPPEVHSTLLSSGPGPGPLLASAAAWSALSTEYTEAADELSALLGAVQAGAWAGPTASAYAAAHLPYLTWLTQASVASAATATQQEAAAVAYTAALAAMPTLAELAANHATHAVLLATNFFGINTIPIALNEADYVRMWIQAATTMSAYQGAAATAVTASPPSTAAPVIAKSNATAAPVASSDPFVALTDFFASVERVFNTVGGEAGGDLISYIFSVPPGTDPVSWFVGKIGTVSSPTGGYPALLQGLVSAAGDNPALLALAYLFGAAAIGYDLTIQVIQFVVTFPLLGVGLTAPLLAVPGALAGLGAGGVVGIVEVAAHAHADVEPIPDAPTLPAVSAPTAPVSGVGTAATTSTATAATLVPAAPAPGPALAGTFGSGAPPPSGAGAGPFPYLVGGTTKMGVAASAQVSVKRKALRPDIAAVPVAEAVSAREKARSRRRRSKAEIRGRGYEYMDLDGGEDSGAAPTTPEPVAGASDRGAGPLGNAVATGREVAGQATGLATLADDAFGGGPREPLMPSTWAPEASWESDT